LLAFIGVEAGLQLSPSSIMRCTPRIDPSARRKQIEVDKLQRNAKLVFNCVLSNTLHAADNVTAGVIRATTLPYLRHG